MSVRRLVQILSVFAVILAASLLTLAQAPKPAAEQPQLMLLIMVKVYPGTASREYINIQTKEVIPAQKKGGSLGRQAFSSGIGGEAGEYAYLSPISSMAQFDSPQPMVQALGEQGAADLSAKLAKVSHQLRTSIIRTRPDLSYIPDPKALPAPIALITEVEMVPGKRAEFEAFIKKDVVAAMQQAKVRGYRVFEVLYGENTGGYISAVGYDSYAAAGKGHPFQIALGEEGARKLEAKAGALVTKIHRFFTRHRPELSWSPTATSNN
jgi:hypothetical protein